MNAVGLESWSWEAGQKKQVVVTLRENIRELLDNGSETIGYIRYIGGASKKTRSGFAVDDSATTDRMSAMTGSTRSEADELEPSAAVRKLVKQATMQTLLSGLTWRRDSAKTSRRPHGITWAEDISGRSRQLVEPMLFLTLESPNNEKT